MATAHGVATIGSASNDDIYFVPRFPKDHETLHATKFVQGVSSDPHVIILNLLTHHSPAFGGKGSNQAVCLEIKNFAHHYLSVPR